MSRPEQRHICLIFIGDIRYDGRGYNIASSLVRAGHRLTLLTTGGFSPVFPLQDSKVITVRLRDWRISKLRFLEFYLRSTAAVIGIKADLYQAEDLFSLPVAWIGSMLHGGRLSYDCRELYFALGSLMGRRLTQAFWRAVERIWIGRADLVMVTAENQVEILAGRYRIRPPIVVRNHPPLAMRPKRSRVLRDIFSIPDDLRILLYQGMLHPGRGIFLPLEILRRTDGCSVVYLAYGELKGVLVERIRALRLEDRAFVMGPVPYCELLEYTAGADIGLALQEPFGENHLRARPNKVFEYIMAGVPVLASDFPPLRRAVVGSDVGLVADVTDMDDVMDKVGILISDSALYQRFEENCRKAAGEYNWEREEAVLQPAVSGLFGG